MRPTPGRYSGRQAKPPRLTSFAEAGGAGKPSYGQVPLSYDHDETAARARAHEQFRWFAGGWKLNAELPGTAGFAAASPPTTDHRGKFADAGFTHLALVQVGGEQQPEFLSWSAEELLPRARKV